MAYEEFFTNRDKPYSENLNDALCLVDAFDLTVPLNMPAGFSNGEFSSNIGITRKCGVGLVTLMSKDSGVTIGTDSISGSGEVVFRIYPNFNSFYKWSKILLTKTGNVTVGFRRVDGTDISVTVDSDGNISDNTDLRELKEIDLVLTLSSATISQVLVWFVNDQTVGRVRSSALLEASQLANVNGQVVAGNAEAVSGGTVKVALDNLIKLLPCMVLTVTGNNFKSYNNKPFTAVGDVIIDWGDNTGLELLNGQMNHNFTDGVNSHTIYVYGNITAINKSAFRECTNLTTIKLPDSITLIEAYGFHSCSELYSIILPNTIKIEQYCFVGCTSLLSIILPEGVSLDNHCFQGSSLTKIYLNWSNSLRIRTYNDSWIINTLSNLKFYIPIGTTSAYVAKGYPSDKLQE